ncbi:hypothetical protein VTL71DRAFT_3471 [Oculimacula yallundae]|uniref:Uncharacterized protein n=1 Tax=Oculimacula yallundae TaxID=86028 RepID=A0ABR4C789_9HELO
MPEATFSDIPEGAEFEEYDNFEEMPTPKTAQPGPSSTATKAKSVMPNALFKDDARAPRAKSVMPSAMFKDDARTPRAKSVMPSALFRDARTPKAKSVMPSRLFSEADFKQVFTTKTDKMMSQRQTQFKTLPPKEQEKQLKWAQDKIEDMAPCPDSYKWERCDQGEWGGMVCCKGTHAMLDMHFPEGQGAIIILAKRGNLGNEGAQRCGPWYPHPSIMNCYVPVPGKNVEGVKPYYHPAFFGSEHQIERAKWEYYLENPGEAADMGYKKPKTEPPEEWAFEKNVPELEKN